MPDLFTSQSPTLASIPVPVWLDLLAVAVGSLSGPFYARERNLDLIGFIGLAILSGLGGGLVRDTIMQVGDVYMLKTQGPILLAMGVGMLGFLFPKTIDAHPRLVEWIDIISVGLFAAAGTDKAILYHINPIAIVLMGTTTGVSGGMLRDIVLGEVPHIFRRSNWYALCAIAGSSVYYLCAAVFMLDKAWAAVACVAITLLLRRISLRYNLYSPANVDLEPAVRRTAKSVADAAREATANELEHARKQHEKRRDRKRIRYGR